MASLSAKPELTPLYSVSQHNLFDILDDCSIPSEFENEWSPAFLGSFISDQTSFTFVPNELSPESTHQEQFSFNSNLHNTDFICKTEPVTPDYQYNMTSAPIHTSSITQVSPAAIITHAVEEPIVTEVKPQVSIVKQEIKREDCCSPVTTKEIERNSIKESIEQDMKKDVRGRGRPRRLDCHSCGDALRAKKDKKPIKMKKTIHLWEFLEQILEDNTLSPRYIAWVSREEGIFRLVNSKKVAQLWGQRKNKRNMTYEKMSRAMRYYYERGILYHVNGQKLIYKFGDDVMSRRQDLTSDSESSEKSV